MALLTAGGVAAGAVVYWAPALTVVSATARRVFGVRARVAAAGAVGLTFDDGPHPQGTPAVLELLEREHVSATFFLVGEQVRRAPGLAAEIRAAGHEVALHCDRHRNLMWRTPQETRRDLENAYETIADAVGAEPRRYRPPYGILSASALSLSRRRGWETVLWTRDGEDWAEQATARSIAAGCLKRIGAGDIVLLHDADTYSALGSWKRTAEALPRILDGLRERGLAVAPLSDGTLP
ncbi:MAG: polysaccharide deacetylase family protein [Gaiellaceae bacterium]